jgi:aminopeptidase N
MKHFYQSKTLFRPILGSTVFLLLLSPAIFATRQEHAVSSWQPTNYDVSLTLNDQLSEITRARVTISVQVLKNRLDTIDLDFGELTIDSVKLGDRDAVFKRAPGLLNVQLPRNTKTGDRFLITIEYHGRPKDGLVLANDKDGKASATGDNWPFS